MLTFLGKDMSFWRGIGRVVSVGRYLSSVAQSRVTRCISQCHPSRSLSSRRLSFLWNEAHRVGTDHARVRALSGGKDFPRDDAGGSARLGEPLDQLRSLLHKPTWSRGGENVPDKLVAKVCVQLLCEAGKSFRKAEAKSGKVSNLPVGFLRSVAGRIVEEHPDSVDKRAILKCAAEEIILHGNRLPVGHTAFVVGSVVGSGYRDLWFMTSVRCMTSNRLNDWMRNMKELAVVLRCLATDSKKDHLMLLMAVSKNFYLVLKAWNDSFPAGLGAILRDCHLHRIEVDHSISQRCLDVLNGHYTQLSCEDLMGMMSFLLQHKVPPSRSQCKAAHRKIMQVVDAVHWRLVKDVIAVTRSMCKTHPGLIWAFDKEGVFDTLHSVLERRVDEMSALGVGQCIADLHRLGRLSFPFLKAAPRVLIKQSHMFTHHYIAEMVCAAYGLSKVPQRSDVVSAIGGKMWSELETLTSQQVFSFLEAFWRVSRRPSFLDDYVSILLSSARGLSERNREYLIFFLMDLRMESKALAECLVADLVEKLDRSTEYVPASARLSVLRYATLCNVSLLSMAPYFTEDVLEGLAKGGRLRQFLPVLHLNEAILMYRRTLASAIERGIKGHPRFQNRLNNSIVSKLSKSRSNVCGGGLINGLFVDAVAVFDADNRPVKIRSSSLESAVSHGLRPVAIRNYSSSMVLVDKQGEFKGWFELELRALKHIGWNVVTVNSYEVWKGRSDEWIGNDMDRRISAVLKERYGGDGVIKDRWPNDDDWYEGDPRW